MNYKRLIISLVLPQLAGLIGSFFTVSSISSWYSFLSKPSFNPPSWVFGPAWLILYFLMGISIYLVWQKASNSKVVWLFWVHLVFNGLWSIVFFGMKNPGLAFINILIIWILIVVLIEEFRKFSRVATYLLIPYLGWVSFAAILNYAIWQLN